MEEHIQYIDEKQVSKITGRAVQTLRNDRHHYRARSAWATRQLFVRRDGDAVRIQDVLLGQLDRPVVPI
jgi:hypothetical protein